MKINLVSDLHLEFSDLVLPGGEVLIISGDLCEVKRIDLSQYEENGLDPKIYNRRPDRFARFFIEELRKYQHVFYVMGNHEHYGFYIDKSYDRLKDLLPSNVTLLENQSRELNGVVFVGATLWTDLNQNDPLTALNLKHHMNDYNVVKKTNLDNVTSRRLEPKDTYMEHEKSLAFLKTTIDSAMDKPVVVITHHAPSEMSIHQQYKRDFHMNGGYYSKLDNFILERPNIKVWTHGHTHTRFDYQVGSTRVLCNPRGYIGYERAASDFDPGFSFEV